MMILISILGGGFFFLNSLILRNYYTCCCWCRERGLYSKERLRREKENKMAFHYTIQHTKEEDVEIYV